MKNIFTLILLFTISSSVAAFTASNETDFMVTINIDKDSWWYSQDYKIIPQNRDCETMQYLTAGEYTKFKISINYLKNKQEVNEIWQVFDRAESRFEVKKENGSIVLFVNGERVA